MNPLIIGVLAIILFSFSPVFAETENTSQTLSTDQGTLDVKLSYGEIVPGELTSLKTDFLNPKTQRIQEHIDWRFSISKDGQTIWGPTQLSHTSKGSLENLKYEFSEDGLYTLEFEIEGILFQPIPLEKVSFDVIVGDVSESQIDPPSLELDSGPASQEIPGWIKNNAGWWAGDIISESEFLRAIEFLIENQIIKIPIAEDENLPSIINTYTLPSERSTEYAEITGSFSDKHEGPLTLTIIKPDKSEETLTTISRDGNFMTTMALTSESLLGNYKVYAEIKGEQILTSSFMVKAADSTKVPSWIKNNADWWAQGLITDDDFVKGIQFLVENNIIRV